MCFTSYSTAETFPLTFQTVLILRRSLGPIEYVAGTSLNHRREEMVLGYPSYLFPTHKFIEDLLIQASKFTTSIPEALIFKLLYLDY
jgi:hypothetical protein